MTTRCIIVLLLGLLGVISLLPSSVFAGNSNHGDGGKLTIKNQTDFTIYATAVYKGSSHNPQPYKGSTRWVDPGEEAVFYNPESLYCVYVNNTWESPGESLEIPYDENGPITPVVINIIKERAYFLLNGHPPWSPRWTIMPKDSKVTFHNIR